MASENNNIALRHIQWVGDAHTGYLRLLDQTKLPTEQVFLDCHSAPQVWDAIKRLVVRGAPAIGIAAAYGCVIGAQEPKPDPKRPHIPHPLAQLSVEDRFQKTADYLATSRPTAINLFWALDRLRSLPNHSPDSLLQEAITIHNEDRAMCRSIGEHAFKLFQENLKQNSSELPGVLTHCNAGALATGGIGTATAPMYVAHEKKFPFRVFADETRPLLQGARLTAFELQNAGIDVTLICDDMAAHVINAGKINMIITGADRIAANGDAANKIGTYNLAVLAHHHNIPFYIAAPFSTFDLSIPDGSHIPIEERASTEITQGFGKQTAPDNINTYSPAFDVTPASLITAIITQNGIISPVTTDNINQNLNQ